MKNDILITYKSVTGFTRDYAEMIAGSLNKDNNCALMDLKEVTAEGMSGFDTVIFGGRMHAGTVDGLGIPAEPLFRSMMVPEKGKGALWKQ